MVKTGVDSGAAELPFLFHGEFHSRPPVEETFQALQVFGVLLSTLLFRDPVIYSHSSLSSLRLLRHRVPDNRDTTRTFPLRSRGLSRRKIALRLTFCFQDC